MSRDPIIQLFEAEATRHIGNLAKQVHVLTDPPHQMHVLQVAQESLSALIATAELVGARELQGRARDLQATLQQDLPLPASADEIVQTLSAAVQRCAVSGVVAATQATTPAQVTPSLTPSADLLTFFRSDLLTCVRELSEGLVRVEAGEDRVAQLDRLMRSAHSLKGASRVVGFDGIVALAHAMEDRFVAAQQERCELSPQHVDLLLSATDQLARLQALPADRLVAQLETSNAALLVHAHRIADSTAGGLTEADLSDVTHCVTAQGAANAGDATDASSERASARGIERLVGLASEVLIEARRAAHFVAALGSLRRRHSTLVERLLTHSTTHTVQGLGEVQQLAEECGRVSTSLLFEVEEYAHSLENVTDRLYSEALRRRMRPFADGVGTLERLARDTARRLGKSVRVLFEGARTEVDRDVLDALQLPLQHLVRNAIDHGIESPEARLSAGKSARGEVRIGARHQAGQLVVTVADDGQGVDIGRLRAKILERKLVDATTLGHLSDLEALEFLFLPGFSTADGVTDISGRGVGLDVVRSAVEGTDGHVRVTSTLGAGTTFHMRLPVTRSVVRALIVEIGGEPYAFPLPRVECIVRVPVEELRSLEGRPYIELNDRGVGVVHAHDLLETSPARGGNDRLLIVIAEAARSFALLVDAFVGERDLVMLPLDARLGKVPNVQAAAILDHGSPILILDVDDLWRSIDRLLEGGMTAHATGSSQTLARRKRILVVDDSLTVREMQRQVLLNAGYDVEVAVDGADGWRAVTTTQFDLVISDVDMPRMNGFQLVRQIKQDTRLESIPVVIVSYKDRPEDRLKGLEVGANYYLTKASFQDRSLLDAVADLIGNAA